MLDAIFYIIVQRGGDGRLRLETRVLKCAQAVKRAEGSLVHVVILEEHRRPKLNEGHESSFVCLMCRYLVFTGHITRIPVHRGTPFGDPFWLLWAVDTTYSSMSILLWAVYVRVGIAGVALHVLELQQVLNHLLHLPPRGGKELQLGDHLRH